jgi:DNA-binding CsgD family transcriptional regulator
MPGPKFQHTSFDPSEIHRLYAEGLSSGQVADSIGCSKRTVFRVLGLIKSGEIILDASNKQQSTAK